MQNIIPRIQPTVLLLSLWTNIISTIPWLGMSLESPDFIRIGPTALFLPQIAVGFMAQQAGNDPNPRFMGLDVTTMHPPIIAIPTTRRLSMAIMIIKQLGWPIGMAEPTIP